MITQIANHLWQSTLFILGIAIAARLLRHNSARVRYWIWFSATLKLLVPFSALTAIGGLIAAFKTPALLPTDLPALLTMVVVPVATPPPSALVAALIAVWACGSVAVSLRWLTDWRKLRRALCEATPANELGAKLPDGVMVCVSRARIEPGLVGIVRPKLLLPHGIEQSLTRSELEAVIAHELVHLHRRDNLTAAIHMIAEALFWFHPLVWWVGARLVEERERACDEAVLASGFDPATYAESILNVCELYVASPMRCVAGISGGELKARIGSILEGLHMSELQLSKRLALFAAALAVFTIPLFVGLVTHDSGGTAIAQDRDYVPIVVVAPKYPEAATAQGLEGYVILRFTVTTTGATRDVTVVESSSAVFEQAAIEAASKSKYQPRVADGVRVEVPGVHYKVTFALDATRGEDRAYERTKAEIATRLVEVGLDRSDVEAIMQKLVRDIGACGSTPEALTRLATGEYASDGERACWLDAAQKAGISPLVSR